jgi:hypothetical protein
MVVDGDPPQAAPDDLRRIARGAALWPRECSPRRMIHAPPFVAGGKSSIFQQLNATSDVSMCLHRISETMSELG